MTAISSSAAPSRAADGPLPRTRSYTPGFTDQLGDRQLAFDHASATSLEVLRFKKEFSESPGFEVALRLRVEQLAQLQHPSLAVVRSVERLEADGGLSLVSKHTSGRRVSELVQKARGPVFALELIRQVTPALAALQLAGEGVSHGALSAERIVVTREGRLVVVEHVLGFAIESLELPPQRLADLGLVMPAGSNPVRFDSRTDMIQLGFIALSLLVGRRLDPAEYPEHVPALLDEFTKSAAGGTLLASRLRTWLERALQIGDQPFASAQEAHEAFTDLPDEIDMQAAESARTLLAFPTPGEAAAAAVTPSKSGHSATSEDDVNHARGRHAAEIYAPHVTVTQGGGAARWVIAGLATLAAVEAGLLVVMYARPAVDVIEVRSPRTEAVRTLAASALPAPVATAGGSTIGFLGYGSAPAGQKPADGTTPPASGDGAPALAAGARFGGLNVTSSIELQVFKDGALLGSSAGPIAINDGSHVIDLVNETLGFRYRETVTVKAGQLTSLKIAVPNGRVSINANPWAEVLIDGTPAGQTPLANIALAIGSHEIVFRHPQFPEQRQTVVVKVAGLTRVSATFQQDFKH